MTQSRIIRIGGYKIEISMDYEALGRYIAAKEKAIKLSRERDRAVSEAKRFLDTGSGGSGVDHLSAREIDFTKAKESLQKAEDLHAELIAAINEANEQAEAADKQKLHLERNYY